MNYDLNDAEKKTVDFIRMSKVDKEIYIRGRIDEAKQKAKNADDWALSVLPKVDEVKI